MEYLIPILMFLFPLAVAILDKQVKKRKGVPPVKARPVFPFEVKPEAYERPVVREGGLAPRQKETPAEPAEPAVAANHEGEHAFTRKKVILESEPETPKFEIDKKKLILYSEILKPKFDN
ncbi:MAG: hypothetical protein K5910_05590 [Bacteroidales bacterium]|nr:hypothetical protein [Bacteroidales bacterium]